MAGVSRSGKRVKENPTVELTSPHGASITVGPKRAEALLARPPIRLGDGSARKYVERGEDTEVAAPTTKAQPPRQGNKSNTPGGE